VARENVFADLRAKYFEIPRPDEVPAPNAVDQAWCAIMEIGYPQAIVTTVAFSDGTARVLRSTGGGFFVAGVVEAVRPAAQGFVEGARLSKPAFTPTTDFPQPGLVTLSFTPAVMLAFPAPPPLKKILAAKSMRCPLFTLRACAYCMSFSNYRSKVSSDKTPNQLLEPTAGRCEVHV